MGIVINSSTGEIDVAASTPGTYRITYTTNNCVNSSTQDITINALPTVAISGTLSYCNGSNTTLTATAGLSSYLWSTGETTQAINVTAGSYTVTGTDANGCSATSSSVTVTELPLDDASFSYSANSYCQNAASNPTTTPATPGGTFSSTTGLSINSTTGEINLAASTVGNYVVTYNTPSGNACPNSSTQNVEVLAVDVASLSYPASSYPQSGTDPSPTFSPQNGGTFTATPSGLSINSSTGVIDLSASSVNSYTITYTSGGTCSDTATFNLSIISISAAFNYSASAYCQDASDPTPTVTGTSGGAFSASVKIIPLKFKVNIQTTTTTADLDFKIPFVNGTNFTINWGDSNIDTNLSATNSSITHRYDTVGTYTIEVGADNSYPTRLAFCAFGGNPNTIADNGALAVTEITQWGSIPWSYVESMWDGCTNLDIISATDTPDFSNLVSHSGSFPSGGLTRFLGGSTNTAWRPMRGPSLGTVNASINTWDVSSVRDFSGCFGGSGATSAFNANINNWDISGVNRASGLSGMFNGCLKFNQPLNNWTLPSSVTNLSSFLSGCEDFNQDISHFNMTNITNISGMFFGCDDFDATNLENWERTTSGNTSTMANVVNMYNLFNYKKDVNQTFNNAISSWNTSGVTNMANLTANVPSTGDSMTSTFVTGWDTSSVSNFSAAFKNTYNFNSNLSSLDISSLTNGSQMFYTWAFGMSTANYTDTLVGWANFVYNNSGPYTVNFGSQNGRTFDRSRSGGANFADAGAARDYLTGATANWTITGDTEIN